MKVLKIKERTIRILLSKAIVTFIRCYRSTYAAASIYHLVGSFSLFALQYVPQSHSQILPVEEIFRI